jgi:hypothetical protein
MPYFLQLAGSINKHFVSSNRGLKPGRSKVTLLQTIQTVPGIYMASSLMGISFVCEGKLAGASSQPLFFF